MEWWFAYISLGLVAGFFAGLLGIGAGLIMVPVLTELLLHQGMTAHVSLRLALGTSMAAIVTSAALSTRTHHRHDAVLWPVVKAITPGILLGTLAGTLVAREISTRSLALFFVGFMLFVAMQMTFELRPKAARALPPPFNIGLVGLVIGVVSSLAAVGGGALSVPFLVWCSVGVHQAIGTAAAIGFPIALGGTAGYIVNGWGQPDLPSGSLGFVYLPALVGMLMGSLLTTPLGAISAHRLPARTLKRIFAGLALVLAGKMAYGLL